MTNNVTNIRDVSVDVMFIGEVLNVHKITITHTVNTVPIANIHIQKENNKGELFDLAEQVDYIETFHNSVTSMRTEPDMRIYLEDGNDGSIGFNAFLTKPSLTNGHMYTGTTITGLHESSVLSLINPSIYKPHPGLADASETARRSGAGFSRRLVGSALPNGKESSIAERIDALLKVAVKEGRFQGEVNSNEEIVYRNTKATNELFLPSAHSFLDRSSNGSELLGSEFLQDSHSRALNTSIENLIFTNSSLLSAILFSICPEFLMQFTTDLVNDNYVLERSQVHAAAEEEIHIPVENLNYSLESGYNLPLSQIIIDNPDVRARYVQESQVARSMSVNRTIGRFPLEPFVEGRVERIKAPSWLHYSTFNVNAALGVFNNTQNQYYKTLDDVISAYRDLSDARDSDDEDKLKFLHSWAKLVYYEKFLETATATISTPLNLKLQPGKTYKVFSYSGVELFEAYLYNVYHSISVDKQFGTALSNLSFSHVKIPGFVLPD